MVWQNKYERVPFKEKGRDLSGCDCWGLVRIILKEECGIDVPSYVEAYETTNDRDTLNALISDESGQYWQEIPKGQEKPFDVVVLKMRGVPMHVGIVIGAGKMIHCARGVGTAIERYRSIKWQDNVTGFFRWRN